MNARQPIGLPATSPRAIELVAPVWSNEGRATYRKALELAASTGKTQYVNVYRPNPRNRSEWFLFIEPFMCRDCCAIATPDGELEFVVQGYSHQVAMTQGAQA